MGWSLTLGENCLPLRSPSSPPLLPFQTLSSPTPAQPLASSPLGKTLRLLRLLRPLMVMAAQLSGTLNFFLKHFPNICFKKKSINNLSDSGPRSVVQSCVLRAPWACLMSLFPSPIGSLGHRGLRDSSTGLTPFPSNFLSEPGLILSSVLGPSRPLCHSGEGAPAAGRKRLARVVTHGDPDCNSPKFSVTQRVNRRPGFPTASCSPPPPASQMGRQAGGEGQGKKGQIVQKKTEETGMARDRKRRHWER